MTYLHLVESYIAWSRIATMGAWSLQVPIEKRILVILWLRSIWAIGSPNLRERNLKTYQFDGDLFVIFDVGSVVDITESSTHEFSA